MADGRNDAAIGQLADCLTFLASPCSGAWRTIVNSKHHLVAINRRSPGDYSSFPDLREQTHVNQVKVWQKVLLLVLGCV